jgi:hypothetical protein
MYFQKKPDIYPLFAISVSIYFLSAKKAGAVNIGYIRAPITSRGLGALPSS